jgi:hypothetical protein
MDFQRSAVKAHRTAMAAQTTKAMNAPAVVAALFNEEVTDKNKNRRHDSNPAKPLQPAPCSDELD